MRRCRTPRSRSYAFINNEVSFSPLPLIMWGLTAAANCYQPRDTDLEFDPFSQHFQWNWRERETLKHSVENWSWKIVLNEKKPCIFNPTCQIVLFTFSLLAHSALHWQRTKKKVSSFLNRSEKFTCWRCLFEDDIYIQRTKKPLWSGISYFSPFPR